MSPEKEAPSLLVMRHGETAWNRERRVMGTADVPLTERGREQCERAARVLAGFGIQRIVSSPLVRATESAEIIGRALGIEITHDADLEEVRFGRWQGKTYDEIATDPDYRAFASDPVTHRTPGGETIVDVQRRGLAGLERALPGERVLFVSHGDIIRSTLCHFLAIPIVEFRRVRIDNCGISAVTLRRRRPEVKFVNMLADPDRVWESLHWASKPV
jgi:broad specificity phosphatase PhoE